MPYAPPLVLHVIHHLVIGGMENGLVNLINEAPATKIRHGIICIEDFSDFRNRLKRDDVEVYALHRSRVGVWAVRRRLFDIFREKRPAIVHSRNLSGLDALLPAKLAGVPQCIHGEHGRDISDPVGDKWRFRFLRWAHSPMVDRYITVSKDLRRYLIDKVRISPARIAQIYNGVDAKRFSPAQDLCGKKKVLPPEFARDDLFVIGTVGRLQPVKDQLTLVRAFISLFNMVPNGHEKLRLVVVGEGPLKQACEDSLRAAGLAKYAWFAGARNDVPDLMRGFDVFVLPSLGEGISNTILEAMASGLPVIATRVGGNPELVEAGVTGRLVAPADPQALAQALLEYVDDPARLAREGAAARARVEAHFSMDAMVRGYLGVYDEVLARR